jgi:hypothetical protein
MDEKQNNDPDDGAERASFDIIHRSGCLHADCITLIVKPEELEAMIEPTGVASSISVKSLTLKSECSGPFSCTKSARDTAYFMSRANSKRVGDAEGDRPKDFSMPQACST